jgi:hypothetical protein
VLTAESSQYQVLEPSQNINVTLPVLADKFTVVNTDTNANTITLKASNGDTIDTFYTGSIEVVPLTASPTTGADWYVLNKQIDIPATDILAQTSKVDGARMPSTLFESTLYRYGPVHVWKLDIGLRHIANASYDAADIATVTVNFASLPQFGNFENTTDMSAIGVGTMVALNNGFVVMGLQVANNQVRIGIDQNSRNNTWSTEQRYRFTFTWYNNA